MGNPEHLAIREAARIVLGNARDVMAQRLQEGPNTGVDILIEKEASLRETGGGAEGMRMVRE